MKKYPFELDEDKSLLVARYMVEETEEKKIPLEMERRANVARVRSILKHFLQNYEIFKNDSEITSEISGILSKYKMTISDQIRNLVMGKDICKVSEFQSVLASIDVSLPNRLWDFLAQKNYEITHSV